MKTQVQTVTPEIATHFLQKNQGNRDYRKSWVAHLSRIIKNGEWMVTHQGIALDKTGNLIDGQHRLLAIIDSGMPVQINVTYDAEANTYECIDLGVKRNLADVTRFNKKTAEVCSVMSRFLGTGYKKIPTASEAKQIYDNGIGKISDELNEFANKNVKFYSSAPFRLAVIIMVMDGHDKEYVFNSYYNLINLNMDKLPPIAHSLIKQVHNYSINLHEKNYTIARALKVFDAKRENTQLVLTANDLANVAPYVRNVYKNYAAQRINNG
jgi:hypothetical protein